MNLTEEQIEKALNDYIKKKERENKYYHNVSKDNEDFKVKNRQRARDHYMKNKDVKKESYNANREVRSAKSLYNYYHKHNNVEGFIAKHPLKHSLLLDKGLVN